MGDKFDYLLRTANGGWDRVDTDIDRYQLHISIGRALMQLAMKAEEPISLVWHNTPPGAAARKGYCLYRAGKAERAWFKMMAPTTVVDLPYGGQSEAS